MKRKIVAYFTLSTLLFSCKAPTTFKEEKFDGFSMKVADLFTAIKKPEIRSSAYYEDTISNCLFMVVKESKDTMIAYGLKYDLNSYFKKTYNSLASKLKNGKLSIANPDAFAETINTNKAIVGKIVGSLNDDALLYFVTVVETRKCFYQIIFGMPKGQEDRYTGPMDEMRRSFKEI